MAHRRETLSGSRSLPAWAVAIAICGAMLAGCGGGQAQDASSQTAADEVSASVKPKGEIPTQSPARAAKRSEPAMEAPSGPPPTKKVVVTDLIRGTGKRVGPHSDLSVHFTAIRYDGEFFESIWKKPFEFKLGANEVNPGWEQGLPGMRAGGRRLLIVPTQLTSRFGVSPYNESPRNALVYAIDLLGVR